MNRVKENPSHTTMDYFKSLPEGTLAELIDNVIYMSPAPVLKHHRLTKKLFRQLDIPIESKNEGEVIFAPFDVYLDETSNAVQPDFFVVLNGNPGQLNPDKHFHGVPDFIIEILSPSNRRHDLIVKKSLYERFGVKEYWIIDPDTRDVIGHSLQDGSLVVISNSKGKIESQLLNVTITF